MTEQKAIEKNSLNKDNTNGILDLNSDSTMHPASREPLF